MGKKFRVAGIGELLWDILPQGKQLGGAPCNFAYHAFQAGCEVFVISAVGQDESGDEIFVRFDELNLNKNYVQRSSEFPTGTVTVFLDSKGIPQYQIHENVAWDYIRWESSYEKFAKTLDAVCFGSLAQRNPVSKECIGKFLEATKPECLRVFDINLRQSFFSREIILNSLKHANILKLNEDELPIVADLFQMAGSDGELLVQLILKFNLKLIALTKGEKGSILFTLDEQSFMEAPKVEIADTVGAGDSFTAILIDGLLKQEKLSKIHNSANRVAAYVCTQKGATPKVPEELFNL